MSFIDKLVNNGFQVFPASHFRPHSIDNNTMMMTHYCGRMLDAKAMCKRWFEYKLGDPHSPIYVDYPEDESGKILKNSFCVGNADDWDLNCEARCEINFYIERPLFLLNDEKWVGDRFGIDTYFLKNISKGFDSIVYTCPNHLRRGSHFPSEIILLNPNKQILNIEIKTLAK